MKKIEGGVRNFTLDVVRKAATYWQHIFFGRTSGYNSMELLAVAFVPVLLLLSVCFNTAKISLFLFPLRLYRLALVGKWDYEV